MTKGIRYTTTDLANEVQADFKQGTGINLGPKDSEKLIKTVFNAIKDIVKDSDCSVRIHNFGVFSMKQKPARTCRNPQTGEPVQVAASESIHFKPSKPSK